MPFHRFNQRTFHRLLFSGMKETVTLLKRGNDQQQGTVTAYTLFDCWPSQIRKTGETQAGDMVSDHRVMWNIPRIELIRVGVHYLNPLDRIVGTITRGQWQPESETQIEVKLMENYVNLYCLRVTDSSAG